MMRELPTWATPARYRSDGRTWPADLGRVVWGWGRKRLRPANAPELSDVPLRRRRLGYRPGASLWVWRQRLIVDIVGADNVVGLVGPVVVAANQQSVLDLQVLKAALPKAWRCVSSEPEPALAARRSVVLFTQGGPSEDGRLGRFSTVPAELARNHNVPIVPVAISGTYNLKAILTLRSLKERQKVQVRFGVPIAPRTRSIRSTTSALQHAITELLAEDELSWWKLQQRDQRANVPETQDMAKWRRRWDQTSGRRRHSRRRTTPIWGVPEPVRKIHER